MNFRLHSLALRLTFAYGASVIALIVLFTAAVSIFIHGFATEQQAQIAVVERRIDPLMRELGVREATLAGLRSVIERRLTAQGVFVAVHVHRDGMEEPPPMFRDRGRREERVRSKIDIIMSVLCDVKVVHRRVPGGDIVILPRPTELGGHMRMLVFELAMLTAVLIFVAGMIGRALTLRSFSPLREVNRALAELADGKFTASPVSVSAESEIGDLAQNYNRAALRVTSAIKEREQNEERMRRFIGDASHELRTPLTVMLGYVDALRKESLLATQTFDHIFTVIDTEGKRMQVLIENLSLLTKLDQQPVVRIEIVDVSELVSEIATARSGAHGAREFELDLTSDVLVAANRDELHAAVRNIVDNALKYAPTGRITLRTSGTENTASVEISDEGPGIDVHDCARVFERFFRGDVRESVPGSGLGLAIAARAVQRAGGEIAYRSLMPQGACFTIDLPRCRLT